MGKELSVFLSACLSACLFVCLSLCLSVCLSLCPSESAWAFFDMNYEPLALEQGLLKIILLILGCKY